MLIGLRSYWEEAVGIKRGFGAKFGVLFEKLQVWVLQL